MRKTSNFFRIFATLAFLFVFGLQSNKSFAECETIRNIKDDCKDCDYPGAIWVGSNKKRITMLNLIGTEQQKRCLKLFHLTKWQ